MRDRPSWRKLLDQAHQVVARSDARVEMTHAGGLPWDRFPPPRRAPWHRCRPQSWGSLGPFQLVERCMCGAIRIDADGPWIGRHLRVRIALAAVGPRPIENPGDSNPLVVELLDALREQKEH